MTRDELIEAVALELDGKLLFAPTYTNVRFAKRVAEVALTALESALPGLSDVVEGKAVIVSRSLILDYLVAHDQALGLYDAAPTKE